MQNEALWLKEKETVRGGDRGQEHLNGAVEVQAMSKGVSQKPQRIDLQQYQKTRRLIVITVTLAVFLGLELADRYFFP
jgi:hypothetical protein